MEGDASDSSKHGGQADADLELESGINRRLNIGGLIAQAFIDNKTTFLVMVAAFLFGLFALFVTPREENPQISVPSVNVIVPFPGASPQEVENLVTMPMERRIWNIKGVEHVYSISYPDFAVVTAQFLVGEEQEESVFKVYNEVYSNLDLLPSGVQQPLVKPLWDTRTDETEVVWMLARKLKEKGFPNLFDYFLPDRWRRSTLR